MQRLSPLKLSSKKLFLSFQVYLNSNATKIPNQDFIKEEEFDLQRLSHPKGMQHHSEYFDETFLLLKDRVYPQIN